MSSKYYITTPLYYVNDEPHIGHAYTTVLADVLTRYKRLFGEDARFLTGTDEHGQKIVEAAAKSGLTPQEHCDRYASRFKDVWEKLGVQYDVFFRTTNPDHCNFVKEVLDNLNKKGDIYSADYSGWYCTPDERFWTDKDVIDGNCPSCRRPVQQLTEKNYFFQMSKYQGWLIEWINSHPGFIRPESRRNEVLGFLKQPLGDLCISRPKSRLSWGIPLPFDEDYVTYVWFDALLNYLSATRIHSAEGFTPDLWPKSSEGGINPALQDNGSSVLHLIGKDILTTHAVYWPIMLHAAGFEPPTTILAHGWWLVDGGKMSKSVGNVIKPLDMVDKYGTDAFRYVLMSEMTPGQDATFSEEAFIKRYNSDLANDLGNLYSRLAKLWEKFECNKYPVTGNASTFFVPDPDIEEMIRVGVEKAKNHINEELKPNSAIDRLLNMVRGINRQLEIWEPWKTGSQHPEKLTEALAWAFKGLDLTAEYLMPIMPGKMNELREAIALQDRKPHPKAGISLFPRIDVKARPTPPSPPLLAGGEKAANLQAGGEKAAEKSSGSDKASESTTGFISIDDFAKVDLRVGKVIEARRLDGSDKLLVLQVELCGEVRQIVAGIAKSYAPEELIQQSVIVVANLKPVKLRGEWSNGMVLAASSPDRHFIIIPQEAVESGAKVK